MERVRARTQCLLVIGVSAIILQLAGGHCAEHPLATGLRVGAAAVTLEADDSMIIAGGITAGKATGQEGKLRATAVVLEKQPFGKLATITCDVLMITRQHLDPVVAEIEKTSEFFTKFGLDIKNRSPFRYTYIAELSNDWIGYLPDLDAHKLGAYQVWTGLHSCAEPGTGERIVEESVRMLNELAMQTHSEKAP